MPTLIFPALNQLALDYRDVAQRRGEAVVAAASTYDARAAADFGELIVLPYVYEPTFRDDFLALLASRGIDRIYAPVASVHAFLEAFLPREGLAVTLAGDSPIAAQVQSYRRLLEQAAVAQSFVDGCAGAPGGTLSRLEIAAILRHAASIYGESNEEKLTAMMAIFASVPAGDVVEIGSLMGKSAFVMQHLAYRYGVGAVLSVDPLSPATSFQHDMPQEVQVAMDRQWDYDTLRAAFAINLLPVARGRFNYLRETSERGFELYRSQSTISSPEFGEVPYAGRIGAIHVDGNHDLAVVEKDCELWLTLLAPGAWLILDDYIWAHGDGPYRVGNALLETRRDDVERAFVCGKALFVKFR